MDEFQQPDTSKFDLEVGAAVPPIWVRFIGGIVGAAGFFMVGSAVQLVMFFYLATWVKATVAVVGVLGLAMIGVSPWIFKARSWASIAGTALCIFAALVSGVWTIYAISITLFSPLMLLAAFMCCVAALTIPLTIPASLRVTAARNALYE